MIFKFSYCSFCCLFSFLFFSFNKVIFIMLFDTLKSRSILMNCLQELTIRLSFTIFRTIYLWKLRIPIRRHRNWILSSTHTDKAVGTEKPVTDVVMRKEKQQKRFGLNNWAYWQFPYPFFYTSTREIHAYPFIYPRLEKVRPREKKCLLYISQRGWRERKEKEKKLLKKLTEKWIKWMDLEFIWDSDAFTSITVWDY